MKHVARNDKSGLANSPKALRLIGALLLLQLMACVEGPRGHPGDQGDPGAPGDEGDVDPGDGDTPTTLVRGEQAPGVVATILSLEGASAEDGSFRVGDRITVRYTLEKADGSAWELHEMTRARVMVSGPTFNYQRVLPERGDVATASLTSGAGIHSYTFDASIPEGYAPPYNDTASYGPLDGELTGEPLLTGTYTLGLNFIWAYTLAGEELLDVGEATFDFILGSQTELAPRDVVAIDNCNRCHTTLQSHHGERRNLLQCLMCHTAGSEDLNDPQVGAGTPGVSINSRVLFHKIHNGAHLPSVIGLGIDAQGRPDYSAEPRAYVVADSLGNLRDYSQSGFPAWPNRTIPMPHDSGYPGLSQSSKDMEDAVGTGITSCYLCHGDPDGDGPLEGPADGDVVYSQASRQACGSCHDDVDWTKNYSRNGQTMAPQPNDSECLFCHHPTSGELSIIPGHLHPLRNPLFNPGLHVDVLSVAEGAGSDGNGSIDPGEGLAMTFAITDDAGIDVDPAQLDQIRAIVSGPTANSQVLLNTSIPIAALTGPAPYSIDLPQRRILEWVGTSTADASEQFFTERAPHLDVPQAETLVRVRRGTPEAASTLAAPVRSPINYVDVVDATGFARDNYVVIDAGLAGREEYAQIQLVDGNRLWFGTPVAATGSAVLNHDHAAGATVSDAPLVTLLRDIDYSLDPATGSITELSEFGVSAAVLVDSTSSWRMPASYPLPLNAGADLGATSGAWAGEALLSGTYSVNLWLSYEKLHTEVSVANLYPITSSADRQEFLVGSAATLEPYDLIASAQSCYACHQDIWYHGGRDHGFDSCLACHGSAGAADLPQYVAANAPATEGATVSFRTMVHKIHSGQLSSAPADYVLVGKGSGAYPDNFKLSRFDGVLFPAMPNGTQQCAKCHGAGSASWQFPKPREHPDVFATGVRAWAAVCAACHDAPAETAHIAAQTAPDGHESCTICHGAGQTWDVDFYHPAK